MKFLKFIIPIILLVIIIVGLAVSVIEYNHPNSSTIGAETFMIPILGILIFILYGIVSLVIIANQHSPKEPFTTFQKVLLTLFILGILWLFSFPIRETYTSFMLDYNIRANPPTLTPPITTTNPDPTIIPPIQITHTFTCTPGEEYTIQVGDSPPETHMCEKDP